MLDLLTLTGIALCSGIGDAPSTVPCTVGGRSFSTDAVCTVTGATNTGTGSTAAAGGSDVTAGSASAPFADALLLRNVVTPMRARPTSAGTAIPATIQRRFESKALKRRATVAAVPCSSGWSESRRRAGEDGIATR